MTQFNPKLRYDSKPDSLWDATEFNSELNSIDSAMQSIPGILLDTTTNQTVNGQKTFFNLYTESSNIETYTTYMDISPTDISPVFGAGNLALELNGILQFGGYTKPNVSGYTFNMTPLNPSFMNGSVRLESLSTTTKSCVSGNIPLMEYDSTKDGTLPPLIGNTVESRGFITSVTIPQQVIGISTNSSYTGDFTPDTWVYLISMYNSYDGGNSIVYIQARATITLDQKFSGFRKLGIYKVGETNSSILEYVLQMKGNEFFTSSIIKDSTLSNYTKSLGVDCLVELLVDSSIYKYSISYQEIGINLYENIPAGRITNESLVQSKSNFGVSYLRSKVPYIYGQNGDLSITPVAPNTTQYIKRLNHGDIIL
jgi:hypothetical protein